MQRIEHSDGPGIVLVDRLGISEPSFIPEDLLPIVGRCTGEWTLGEIREQAAPQYGGELPAEFVQQVVDQLEDRALLLGGRFETAIAERAAQFIAEPRRAASHAGSAGYPADAAALRAALRRLVSTDCLATEAAAPVRGLVAPHIDLARGERGYAAAYGHLLTAEPADLYVIFGTGHAGPSAPVTGLSLDWQTPLGIAATDRAFVEHVHRAIGPPSPGDLLIHRAEHSIEFQVLLLQHVHEALGIAPPRVAGFLCGALPSATGDPLTEDYCRDIVQSFRAAEAGFAGTVRYIAGADLAHIGPFFGDPAPVDDARLAQLETTERARLAQLTNGSPGPFHASVDGNGNPDRVCSAPAITLTAELAGGVGELLHYGQARAADDSQTVSFCAMTFAGPSPEPDTTRP